MAPHNQEPRPDDRRRRRLQLQRARRAAVVLAIALGLAIGHIADQFHRGLFAIVLPGRGAAAMLLPLLGVALLAVWTLAPLWAGKERGYARLRIVGALAVLAGLAPYQPYTTDLSADLYRVFWQLGPHRLTDMTLWGLVILGTLLAFVGTRALVRSDGGERQRRGPRWSTTLLAVLTYAGGLACFANPLLTHRLSLAWAPLPLQTVGAWPETYGPLAPGPLLLLTPGFWLLAAGIYLRRRWALQTIQWVNGAGALLAAWVAFAHSAGAGVMRLGVHVLLMVWLSHPSVTTASQTVAPTTTKARKAKKILLP